MSTASIPPRPRLALFRRREVWLPTPLGALLILGALCGIAAMVVPALPGFLAAQRPVGGPILVVEGWLPPRALGEARRVFQEGGYRRLVTTGGPIHPTDRQAHHGNYAQLAAHTLIQLGVSAEQISTAPAPASRRRRTWVSAAAFRDWYAQHAAAGSGVDLLSYDAHARRSWYVYRVTLRDLADGVGVIAVPSLSYEHRRWWRSSEGVRTVLAEALFYFYARWFEGPEI